jgi:hypothetical protein
VVIINFNIASTCTDGYCLNGGKCVIIMDSAVCNCAAGFTGVNCQMLTAEISKILKLKSNFLTKCRSSIPGFYEF